MRIYYDALDTVRMQGRAGSELERDAQLTGLAHLVMSVLSGEVPVLSQTQVFDSTALLAAADVDVGHPVHFGRLIVDGHVQVVLHRQPDLLSAAVSAMRNANFVFSAWPEVDAGIVDRRQVAEALEDEKGRGLPKATQTKIETVRYLSRSIAVATHSDPRRTLPPLASLSQLIEVATARALEKGLPSFPIWSYLADLRSDEQSVHYSALAAIKSTGFIPASHEKARTQVEPESVDRVLALVNTFYSLVVAASLQVERAALTGPGAWDLVFREAVGGDPKRFKVLSSRDRLVSLPPSDVVNWDVLAEFMKEVKGLPLAERIKASVAGRLLATDELDKATKPAEPGEARRRGYRVLLASPKLLSLAAGEALGVAVGSAIAGGPGTVAGAVAGILFGFLIEDLGMVEVETLLRAKLASHLEDKYTGALHRFSDTVRS